MPRLLDGYSLYVSVIVPSVQITVIVAMPKFQESPLAMFSHCAFVPSKVMDVRPMQSKKTSSPMSVTLVGMVIDARLSQPSKAQLKIVKAPARTT